MGSLVLNLLSRSFWTETFLAVPAARPRPRLFTRCATVSLMLPMLLATVAARDGCEAEMRDS